MNSFPTTDAAARREMTHEDGAILSTIAPLRNSQATPGKRPQRTTNLASRKVTIAFRALLKATYPALATHPQADIFWRVCQYFLLPPFKDKLTGKIVLTHTTIKALFGTSYGNTRQMLELFAAHIAPLKITRFPSKMGLARVVQPQWDPHILPAFTQMQADIQAAKQTGTLLPLVYMDSGQPVSRRKEQGARKQANATTKAAILYAPASHPAHAWQQYLNRQPQTVLHRYLASNRPALEAVYSQMPANTPHETEQQSWVREVLDSFDAFDRPLDMLYTASLRSPRLHNVGLRLHHLPKKLRQLALTGAVELDLVASQLAIVSEQWSIPDLKLTLQRCLDQGTTIWERWLSSLNLPPERKGILKRTIYAIVFGMELPDLKRLLAGGQRSANYKIVMAAGIGKPAAETFFAESLVQSLLTARGVQITRIAQLGGDTDAFGTWIPIDNSLRQEKSARSVLSQVVQSFEMELMAALWPIIQQDRQIRVLSWLHDGVTLHLGDKQEATGRQATLQTAVDARAQARGYPTKLTAEHLVIQNILPTEEDYDALEEEDL